MATKVVASLPPDTNRLRRRRSCQLPRHVYSPQYNSILLMSYQSPSIHQVLHTKSHNITGHLHPDALNYFLLTFIMPFLSISAIAGLINKRKLLTSQHRMAFRRTSPPPWYTTNSSWAPSPTSRPSRPSQCWTTPLRYKLLFSCTNLNYIWNSWGLMVLKGSKSSRSSLLYKMPILPNQLANLSV